MAKQENPAALAMARTGSMNASFCKTDCSQCSPPNPAPQVISHVARRRYLITRLHRLGPAPLFHFISDIERGAGIDATLERYAALPADFIRAYGGGRFLEPMFAIRGGRR